MKNIPIYYDSDNKLEMFISDTGSIKATLLSNEGELKANIQFDLAKLDGFDELLQNEGFLGDVNYELRSNITMNHLRDFNNPHLVICGYVCAAVLAVYKVYATETDYLKQ